MSRFEQELSRVRYPVSRQSLLAAGVRTEQIRGSAYQRSTYGHYRVSVEWSDQTTTGQRIVDKVPLVPPGGALGGWAAAYVLGADWLDGIHSFTLHPLPVLVVLGRAVGRGQNVGAVYARHRLPSEDVIEHLGIPVTTAVRTAFDGMRLAPDLAEAVVFADTVLRFGLADVGELADYVADHKGWTGVSQARQALRRSDPRVFSPWESRLRTFYVMSAGLPSPLVNPRLVATNSEYLGRPDLFDPEAALAVEFDGAGHRERSQHSDDNVREEKFEHHNVVMVRVDSLQLGHDRVGTRARLRNAYERGLRRDRRQDRWRLLREAAPSRARVRENGH